MPMQIRPPNTYLDASANPAISYTVHIGKVNTNPETEINKLVLTDASSGVTVSNPYIINVDGHSINTNGQLVNPQCEEEAYSIKFNSPGGGTNYPYENIKSDAFGITGATSTADKVFNNFPLAQSQDLSTFDIIYIQAKTAGWEATLDGPDESYYAYRTGASGSPGTGTFDSFFDSAGNGWEMTITSKKSASNYLGKKIQGIATITKNLATFQAISSDTGADSQSQGFVYDYGSSPQTIVIPAGIDSGYFRYTVNPATDASIVSISILTGDITVSMFRGGVRDVDLAEGYSYTNSVAAAAKSTISVISGITPVTEGESYDLRIIMNGEDSFGADPTIYMSLEFIPIFNVTIT